MLKEKSSKSEEVNSWMNYYKEQNIESHWCECNGLFLIYELYTNKLLVNINFPVELIPSQIVQ